MKGRIATSIEQGNRALRSVPLERPRDDSDTVRVKRQPVDYRAQKDASAAMSGWVVIVIGALIGAAAGIGLVIEIARTR